MSGGCFNYRDAQLKDEIFGWCQNDTWNGRNVLEDRELSEMLYDMFTLLHDYDWYISSDTGEETYLKSKKAFKDKWLKNPRVRVQRVIDTAVEELRQEMYKTYGIEDKTIRKNGDLL